METVGGASERPQAQSMVTLLDRVVALDAAIETELLIEFARRVLDLMVTEGPGTDFREHAKFVAVTDTVIDLIQARGGTISGLLLAQEQYYAFFADLGPGRVARIRRAVETAATGEEKLRAALTLVRFHIDGSDYGKARRQLRYCHQEIDPSLMGRGPLLDLYATEGILEFYDDKERAEKSFGQVLAWAPEEGMTEYEGRCVGLALHYLGRIRVTQRRWSEAIDLMLRGDRTRTQFSGPNVKGTAFNHLRIAEVLLLVDEIAAAEYHLSRCASLLRLIGESSNADLQMNLTAARLERAKGDPLQAMLILRRCLSTTNQDENPRVLLQCLHEMCKIELSSRRFTSLAATLVRGGSLFLRTQVRSPSGFFRALHEGFRFAVPRPVLTSRPRNIGVALAASARVRCPCGEHEYEDA